jgi:uncharacterized protein DUF3597
MSIFGKLMSKIFGRGAKAAAPVPSPTVGASVAPETGSAATATAAPAANVDVEEILESRAAKNPQKLNWRTSIVDLMKLVGMESSLAERKELAQELGYTGDLRDTAGMNIWLQAGAPEAGGERRQGPRRSAGLI